MIFKAFFANKFSRCVCFLTLWATVPTFAADPQPAKLAWEDLPPALEDKEFNNMVKFEDVRQAIQKLDSELLLEQTKKLAAAEKKVGRSHKHIPSEALFLLTLRAIVEEHDEKKLLDQVEGMLDELNQADSKPLIAETRKLLAAPRRVDLGPGVQLNDVSSEAIILYGALKERIRVAKVVGDAKALLLLKRIVAAKTELHPKQRAYLIRVSDDSLAALSPKTDPKTVALSQLAGLSRGSPDMKDE